SYSSNSRLAVPDILFWCLYLIAKASGSRALLFLLRYLDLWLMETASILLESWVNSKTRLVSESGILAIRVLKPRARTSICLDRESKLKLKKPLLSAEAARLVSKSRMVSPATACLRSSSNTLPEMTVWANERLTVKQWTDTNAHKK